MGKRGTKKKGPKEGPPQRKTKPPPTHPHTHTHTHTKKKEKMRKMWKRAPEKKAPQKGPRKGHPNKGPTKGGPEKGQKKTKRPKKTPPKKPKFFCVSTKKLPLSNYTQKFPNSRQLHTKNCLGIIFLWADYRHFYTRNVLGIKCVIEWYHFESKICPIMLRNILGQILDSTLARFLTQPFSHSWHIFPLQNMLKPLVL